MAMKEKQQIAVLRIGHRLVRDDRVTTHAALVSRAFGAERIYMTGIDQSVKDTVNSVCRRWGGNFEVEIIGDWKGVARAWKKSGGKIAHLTMYGINIDDVTENVRREEKLLVIIGAEKVPREAYELADYNIAIGNQPHSEIAALAIFLDRMFSGKQFKKEVDGGKLRIVPSEKGKQVVQKI
ncbi:MAG TPA: tRNA (cytidine(56)-2'-O)-methyltransferase [Nitrososphaera sp.]|nr:tRNA (cytidine(56)-2'-O)-methyltransferase [Nitrososphaera sp.]